MSFQVAVTGVDELSARPRITQVAIRRSAYDHSRATLVFRWDEQSAIGERKTAALAAQTLGCPVTVSWKEDDLSRTAEVFKGYVERANARREHAASYLTLECVTASKRTDLVPRYRAFQATTLADICDQIKATEPLIKVQTAADLNFDIPLSIQYGETDWQYLNRMLGAWGIPLAVNPKTGDVVLGARGTAPAAEKPFPDASWGGWESVSFEGSVDYFFERKGGGAGATGSVRGQVGQFNGQVKPKTAEYAPVEDVGHVRKLSESVQSQVTPAFYRLALSSDVLNFAPGDVVKFEGTDCLVRAVTLTGDPRMTTARQEFELQPYTLPYRPDARWECFPARAVWAYVKDNEKDPMQAGRVQVEFEWEKLDKPASDQVWLPTTTPYGGGKSPSAGKAGSYSGFYSLPEVGERVLVQFLGDWDSEAVVLGTVRHAAVGPMYNAKDTKRWRTPSGNEVTLTSSGGTEVVRLKCKDKIFFEAKMNGPMAEVTITPGESDGDFIAFQKGAGPPRLDIECGGMINVKAGQKLHLEGQMVQIKSAGNVNIDGATVMINCVPLPLIPGQRQKFKEREMSTSSKPRKLPSLATAPGASGGGSNGSGNGNGANNQPDKKKTWIEITLKDAEGNPVAGERYKLKLADGRVMEGRLDANGRARVNGIDPGTAQVSFPDRDAGDWKPAG